MSFRINHRDFASAVFLVLATLLAGCDKGPTVESFHPQQDIAQEALNTALTAWQDGQLDKSGMTEAEDPRVQLVDPVFVAGSKLKSFEVIQDFPGESTRKFLVRLTVEGSASPQEATYYVVGKDPLQVMNKSEYERDAGM